MIVEDHAHMRRMLINLVYLYIEEPIEFIECESGEEGIFEFKRNKPDLVLMDIELKEINGFETTQQIYAHNPAAKIIIITSHNTKAAKEKAKKIGVQGFILKDQLSDLKNVLIKTINNEVVSTPIPKNL